MAKKNKGGQKPADTKVTPTAAPVAETVTAPTEKAQELKTEKVEKPKKVVEPKKAAETEEIPLVETVDARETKLALSTQPSKAVANSAKLMSPDAKVNLACLMQKRYIDNPDAAIKYGQAFIDEADNLVDNIALLAVLDLRAECIERGMDLNLTVNGNRIFPVEHACKMLGITLPKPKLLENGQKSFEFTEAKVDKNIEEAVAQDRKARKTIEDRVPELDPSKITSDEELVKALEYQMRSAGQNAIKGLLNTIAWFKPYLLFKTTNADEKLRIESESFEFWIEEILKHIKPTLLFTGIGRAIYTCVASDGHPIAGHMIIRKSVLKDNGELILSEEEVAEIVTTLLKSFHRFSLDKEVTEIKDKKIDERAIKALLSGSEALIETILNKVEPSDKKSYSLVQNGYFPSAEASAELRDSMHRKIGQILNLYLPITERMEHYPAMTQDEYPASTEPTVVETVEEKKN